MAAVVSWKTPCREHFSGVSQLERGKYHGYCRWLGTMAGPVLVLTSSHLPCSESKVLGFWRLINMPLFSTPEPRADGEVRQM